MIIWDIGGEQMQARIPDSYYLGSSGVVYVFDVTRPDDFKQIAADIAYIQQKLPRIPIITVGNKIDLLNDESFAVMKSLLPIKADFYSSAFEGKNVENIFLKLAESITDAHQ